MSELILPPQPPEAKAPRPGEPEIAQAWLECLTEAIAMRTEQRFHYRLKTAPELRQSAWDMGPLAGEFGVESPVLCRALAALITMVHPLVLLATLAGIHPPTRKRRSLRPPGRRHVMSRGRRP